MFVYSDLMKGVFYLRYESFYPFAHHPTPSARPQNFNRPTFMPPMQNQSPNMNTNQPFESFSNHIADSSRGQGPSKFENYMQTADRFLTTAQQFAPLVQQFAPMISNLPAMWRLYKGFQSMPSQNPTASPNSRPTASQQTTAPIPPTTPRPSMPRIFQPPSP